MDQNQIEMKLNQLEARIESLESSWKKEKFRAEQEVTHRWLKKEQLRESRLTIKVEATDCVPHEPEYKLKFVSDPVKWNNLIRKGLIYRRGDVWHVRKTLAEDEGFLVVEV